MSSDTGQDELRQKVTIYMSLFERADKTDETIMRKAVDGVITLIAAEVAKASRIAVTAVVHVLSPYLTENELQEVLGKLQSLAGQDEEETK